MPLKSLLIANRGEIAVRIARAAAEMNIRTTAIYSADDARSLHITKTEDARALRGSGAAAYLDIEQIIAVAKDAGCDAIHPGYGFLSENAAFAWRCAEERIKFVGPRPELLELFGDKVRARALATEFGVPVLHGTTGPTTLEHAKAFLESLGGGAIMIKALAGGGGRGMRIVRHAAEIDEAYARCESEARAAFGNGAVYVEELMPRARHIEVQIVGDGVGGVSHLWERECSIQRRNQKIVEIAPSPSLPTELRDRLTSAAVSLAREVRYNSLGTFEFLVDASAEGATEFAFIEANARLQVEHTVTEEVTGIDLVKTQLALADGRKLDELGLEQSNIPHPRGYAIQLRVNMESMLEDGSTKPSGGTINVFDSPSGPGVRVDSFAYSGYATSPRFDSLLAKLVVHSPSPDFTDALRRAERTLAEFRIEGVTTNIPFLRNLLRHRDFAENRVHTRFVEDKIAELIDSTAPHRQLFFTDRLAANRAATSRIAGARIDNSDPLAILHHGKSEGAAGSISVEAPAPALHSDVDGPEGTIATLAPMQGTIVSIDVSEGDRVHRGQQLFVMEAMKMEHVIGAEVSGVVRQITVLRGDAIFEGHPLAFIEEADVDTAQSAEDTAVDLDRIRDDLAEVIERHRITLDAARPESVARRRKTGQRTARENIEEVCDPGTFVEYGALAVAAQRKRRTMDDLIRNTPADGLITGLATINADVFDESKASCVVMAYDYTVLAGTQGAKNHRKKDRMFTIAREQRLPLVLFAEGGGGRPGDTEGGGGTRSFFDFPRLSGLVPLIGITSGRCYAGNASLLGCCDVVIAAKNSNIGMGGPAMIEGGGLGIFRPEEIGPMSVQVPNGVVDLAAADEIEAAHIARKYLSYFQGPLRAFECADQRELRRIIPENRLRVYDVRSVIQTLADCGSVMELRRDFGTTMITSLIRIEGRSIGVVANNPLQLAGAIDSDGADKGARFIQLCDAFDIPLLFLCDTPGIMVGPEIEKTALVRHSSRMFLAGANASVPFFTIVLRKAYGLGGIAMAGGSYDAAKFTVAWPTGEFGPMGLEGAVKLGYRNDLAAITDPVERKKRFDEMVAAMYKRGKALNSATSFGIDDVIDPAESRRWILAGLRSTPPASPREHKKYPFIDSW